MITITITKTLDDIWAEPGQLDALSDIEILSLVKEDITEFVDGACWSVDRHHGFCEAMLRHSITEAVPCHSITADERCLLPKGHLGRQGICVL